MVTTSEASEILGISLQGIHYRIKRNQLKSEKKDGKIFVYIDEETIKNSYFSFSVHHYSTKQTSFHTLIIPIKCILRGPFLYKIQKNAIS